VAPKTEWGRILTMIYALIGIPLTFLYLSNIGNFMANCFRMFYKRICCDILCCEKCERARRRERIKIRRQREQAVQRNLLLGIQTALVGYNCGRPVADSQSSPTDLDLTTASTTIPDSVFDASKGGDATVSTSASSPTGNNDENNERRIRRSQDGVCQRLMTSSDGEEDTLSPTNDTWTNVFSSQSALYSTATNDTKINVFSSQSSLHSTESRLSSTSTILAASRRSSPILVIVRETAILDDDTGSVSNYDVSEATRRRSIGNANCSSATCKSNSNRDDYEVMTSSRRKPGGSCPTCRRSPASETEVSNWKYSRRRRQFDRKLARSTSPSPCGDRHGRCLNRLEQPRQDNASYLIHPGYDDNNDRQARRAESHPIHSNKLVPPPPRVATARQELTSSSPAILRSSRFQTSDRTRCHGDDGSSDGTTNCITYSNYRGQRVPQVASRSVSSPGSQNKQLFSDRNPTVPRPSASGDKSVAKERDSGDGERAVRNIRARANWAKLKDQYRKQPQAFGNASRRSALSQKPTSKSSATVSPRPLAVDQNQDAIDIQSANHHYSANCHHSVSFQQTPHSTPTTKIKHSVDRTRTTASPTPGDRRLPIGDDVRSCLRSDAMSFRRGINGKSRLICEGDTNSPFGDSIRKLETEKRSGAVDNDDVIASGRNVDENFDEVECNNVDLQRQASYEFEPLDFDGSGRQMSHYDAFDYQQMSTEHEGKVTVPIVICLIIIAGYIFGGAVLFTLWEDWDYLTGSYFCFITLSTIGFGDIVPGTDMDKWASHEKLVLCVLWLAFGLSLLAMCFNLMQEEVKDKCKWIGLRVGLLRDDEDR